MAEYINNALQTVDGRQNILFDATPVPCTRGYVIHREGSGVFSLKGITNNCFALYRVNFSGNIGLPEGGTLAPIQVAIAISGEALPEGTAIVEPAALEDLWNVSRSVIVRVPRGGWVNVTVLNTTSPEQAIVVQNANLEITRV